MRDFKVTETNKCKFQGKTFKVNTEVGKMVILPFTNEPYRCFYFTGFKIKLINGGKFIIGTLK